MAREKFEDILEMSPVIAAIKDENALTKAIKSDCKIVFILYGTICNIADIVAKIHDADKIAIVHADLINGLSPKDVAIDFIKNNTGADGVISTKPLLIKRAKDLGLIAIQRTFIIDSIAYNNMLKQIKEYTPDAIEILPGVMPRVTQSIREKTDIAIIASGLLRDKKDIYMAIESGADAISTTENTLWSV